MVRFPVLGEKLILDLMKKDVQGKSSAFYGSLGAKWMTRNYPPTVCLFNSCRLSLALWQAACLLLLSDHGRVKELCDKVLQEERNGSLHCSWTVVLFLGFWVLFIFTGGLQSAMSLATMPRAIEF